MLFLAGCFRESLRAATLTCVISGSGTTIGSEALDLPLLMKARMSSRSSCAFACRLVDLVVGCFVDVFGEAATIAVGWDCTGTSFLAGSSGLKLGSWMTKVVAGAEAMG